MDKKRILFIGNDGNLIKEISNLRRYRLIGVVADKPTHLQSKFFGSTYSYGKSLRIPVASQEEFNKKGLWYLNNVFKCPDIIFIQGYRYKIKEFLLRRPRIKIINFHQSYLPFYAGRHPLNWMLINGEKYGGITFHYVNHRFDAGDIILRKKIRITKQDNILSLYRKTIKSGKMNLKKVFTLIERNSFDPLKQNLKQRTYYPARLPGDGKILSTDSILEIENKIRALTFPYPGAYIEYKNKKIVIDGVKPLPVTRQALGIENSGQGQIFIKASDGLLLATKIRRRL